MAGCSSAALGICLGFRRRYVAALAAHAEVVGKTRMTYERALEPFTQRPAELKVEVALVEGGSACYQDAEVR